MEKKKEQAKVLSQEMLADGIYSLWKKIKTGIPCNRRKDRNKTVLGIKVRRYCAGDRTSGKWISI